MNLVYVPCKDKTEARKIAENIVRQKLAFCTNIIHSIESLYLWNGKVEKSFECLLLVKTSQELVDLVINKIKKLHSYKLPVILSWQIDKTTKEVEKWIKDELK